MSSIVRPAKRPVGQRGLQAGRTARSLCALHERITGRVPDVQRRSRPPARAGLGAARCGACPCDVRACYVRGAGLRVDFPAFWFFQRTRARREFPMLFNPRANPVTASYGNGPRRDHAANVRPEAHALPSRERPRPPVRVRACNSRIPPRRLLSKRARLTSHKRALGHTHAVRHHWQSGPRERSRGEAASHPS